LLQYTVTEGCPAVSAVRFSRHDCRDLLRHVVPREQVPYSLGHAGDRTSDLFDRTSKLVSCKIVDQISS
jgi:hypothetical protein